ncbi:hypothetical protein V6N13_120645 [Hibiscus sabdariffa]|uniref:Uncharacterized protein n=1 Tax=Hibiscus sabdariffa TaxID=183260 RepID=A0ABR2E6V3_9ROSI
MATVCLGVSLAEAYAERSLHKKKMKKMEEQEASKSDGNVFDEMKMPAAAGCFSFWVSKKTHSAKSVYCLAAIGYASQVYTAPDSFTAFLFSCGRKQSGGYLDCAAPDGLNSNGIGIH